MYTITLSNGTVISDVGQNGSLLIVKGTPGREVFETGLQKVVVKGKPEHEATEDSPGDIDLAGEFVNATLAYYRETDTMTEIVFRPMSVQELERMRVDSKIEYVAMMTGVDL